MPFSHEKLVVYQEALEFNARAADWSSDWDRKHAVCDQLSRAAESIVERIAMASASFSAMKIRSLEYAVGSTLECAACLDLACIKGLLDETQTEGEKEALGSVLRMLIGLRRSWITPRRAVREDQAEYASEGHRRFHHEELEVYQASLHLASEFSASQSFAHLHTQTFRRLDELLTSLVLNLAEGNGRFSKEDQSRFCASAHEAAIKLAARLDLCRVKNELPDDEVANWKNLLERISAMTMSMSQKSRERARRQSSDKT